MAIVQVVALVFQWLACTIYSFSLIVVRRGKLK